MQYLRQFWRYKQKGRPHFEISRPGVFEIICVNRITAIVHEKMPNGLKARFKSRLLIPMFIGTPCTLFTTWTSKRSRIIYYHYISNHESLFDEFSINKWFPFEFNLQSYIIEKIYIFILFFKVSNNNSLVHRRSTTSAPPPGRVRRSLSLRHHETKNSGSNQSPGLNQTLSISNFSRWGRWARNDLQTY